MPPSRILVSGASGPIGAALVPALKAGGAAVTCLVRKTAAGPDQIVWDPARPLSPDSVSGFDADGRLIDEIHAAGCVLIVGKKQKSRRCGGFFYQGWALSCDLLCGGRDLHEPPAFTLVLELDDACDLGVQRVVTAESDILSGVELRSALANEDLAAADELTREALDTEHLRLRVAAVA